MHIAAGVFLAMGIGIGMFVLLLVLAAIFATKRLKIRKARKTREKFSKRNRRLLLRQLVDKDIAEMMIYSLEELEKATNSPKKPLTWKDRLRIATEVASSLAYLHAAASTSVVHRDIKTSNILLDDRLTAKVSDFGASRGIAIDQYGVTTGIQGTFGYMDPEYYYTRRLTDKSDVYSYGVMLVELLTRKKPVVYISPEGVGLVAHFVTSLNQGMLNEILDEQVIEEGEEEGKKLAEIAAMCLRMKGEDRPTMRNVEMRLQRLQGSEINISVTEEDQVNELNVLTFQGGNTNASDNY
ncbi:wall-associated receptor kinase 3-like [Panicum miliaceum]|uniref:Wall-associated receptor kinase 3-like n=1 Tax=Panicum miliaceum TaxID=4540 RepID=A0A3L6RJ85_PANMI|nr:wall-associated receptor kinase 3-like [Panicum miliaceum]